MKKSTAPSEPITIENPLVIMYESDGKIVTAIHARQSDSYRGFGLLVCDFVRHIGNAFGVSEDEVWEWVDAERYHHTTGITRPS